MVGIATLWDVLRGSSWCCICRSHHGVHGDVEHVDDLGSDDADPDLLNEHKGGDTEIFQYADHATMVYDAPGTMASSPSSSLRRIGIDDEPSGSRHHHQHPQRAAATARSHNRGGHAAHASVVASMAKK